MYLAAEVATDEKVPTGRARGRAAGPRSSRCARAMRSPPGEVTPASPRGKAKTLDMNAPGASKDERHRRHVDDATIHASTRFQVERPRSLSRDEQRSRGHGPRG